MSARSPSVSRSSLKIGGRAAGRRLHLHARGAGLLVVAHRDDAIESFANGVDVRDQNDLLETVLKTTQQIDDVVAARLVERTEDFVEDQQREWLPRTLRDHL